MRQGRGGVETSATYSLLVAFQECKTLQKSKHWHSSASPFLQQPLLHLHLLQRQLHLPRILAVAATLLAVGARSAEAHFLLVVGGTKSKKERSSQRMMEEGTEKSTNNRSIEVSLNYL